MNYMITLYLSTVEKYPVFTGTIATVSNASAVGLSVFVKSAIPYLQFTSLTFGCIIGALTIYGLLRKRFKSKQNKEDK